VRRKKEVNLQQERRSYKIGAVMPCHGEWTHRQTLRMDLDSLSSGDVTVEQGHGQALDSRLGMKPGVRQDWLVADAWLWISTYGRAGCDTLCENQH
jgi:hypothetical protein